MRDRGRLETALRAVAAGATAGSLASDDLEFKEQHRRSAEDTTRALAETAVCLANATGGTIVVGVDDDRGGDEALVGCDLDEGYVRRRVWELTEPHLSVLTEAIHHGAVRLLAVHVPEGPDVFADSRGRITRRMGARCVPLAAMDAARLQQERRWFDPSAQPSGGSVSDVEPAALDTARRYAARLPDPPREMAHRRDADLLRDLRLVDGSGRLTSAGGVLLCRPARPRIVYAFRPTPGGEVVREMREPLPVLLAFERIIELIRERDDFASFVTPDGQQVELRSFPDLAVREAIVNALVHRDLDAPEPVSVEHSPDVLAVTSPGPLVSGVTLDNLLTHPSKPRNALLTGAMRTLGLAEERGRGIDRMYREMLRAGKQPPEFAASPTSVRAALVGGTPDRRVARFVAALPDVEQDDVDVMLVLFALLAQPRVNAPRMARVLQRSVAETETVLRRLRDEGVGLLAPTQRTARSEHPNYVLAPDALRALAPSVAYHRTTGDEIERKVVGLVESEGTVSNRTLRIALDLDVQTCTARLRELVDRGVLVKLGEQRRGPGIRYGPGSAFPGRRPRGGRSR